MLAPGERTLELTQAAELGRPRWGTLARLDPDKPLLYRDTSPASDVPPESTLVVTDVGGEAWSEVISLVPSSSSDRHFVVETDELGRSTIRFGNGVNGENVPVARLDPVHVPDRRRARGQRRTGPDRPHRAPQGRGGLEPVRRHRRRARRSRAT